MNFTEQVDPSGEMVKEVKNRFYANYKKNNSAMKKITLILFIFYYQFAFTQIDSNYNIDTTKLLFTAKLQTISSEGAYFNEQNIIVFLKKQQAFFLKSKGFPNVYFILIENRASGYDSAFIENHKQEFKKNNRYDACDYVLAYYCMTNIYYKLKGFRNNDFETFINDMIRMGNIFNFTIKNKDIFMYSYSVEDLDLACLWEYFFGKRKKNKEYDCIISCKYRDLTMSVH